MAAIGILGCGLIGAGWAALFARAGQDVWLIDPAEDVLETTKAELSRAEAVLGGAPSLGTLHLATPDEDLRHILFLQECLPEVSDLKSDLLAALEPRLSPDTVIASSSSGLSPDDIGAKLAHPGRVIIGHPCNPVWLMPVVELVPGTSTDPSAMARAETLYASAGRTVIRARKPMPGHIVNRLQSALWREMLHLWQERVAGLDDLALAVTEGLAPRWSVMDPGEVFHVSGGAEGMAGFCAALAPEMDHWWADLGQPRLDDKLKADLTSEFHGRSTAEILQRRDQALPQILRARQKALSSIQKGERT